MGNKCRIFNKSVVVYIDGLPYLVQLPISEYSWSAYQEWDPIIYFLDGNNGIFHWKGVASWCQGRDPLKTQLHICRGSTLYGVGRENVLADVRRKDIGFRPVLTPLNPKTLDPDINAWSGIKDGDRLFLGTLYMDGFAISARESLCKQWTPTEYRVNAKLEIGDSHPEPEKQICFIKFKGKLWADRNLLVMISWNDLCTQKFFNCPSE